VAVRRLPRAASALLWLVLCGALIFPVGAAANQVYVTNQSDESISAFSIGAGGSLSPIACTTGCKTEVDPNGVAVSPSGRFVYVVNTGGEGGETVGGTISVFAVEPGGALSKIPCSSNCKTGVEPVGVAVSPSGDFLYAANSESHSVSVFSIGAGGALSPIACAAECEVTNSTPEDIAISPNGQFLYVDERDAYHIAVFAIAANGSLTKVACTSGCATESAAYGLVVSPNGRFIYTAVIREIDAFEIGASGTLTRIPCPSCTTAANPGALAVSPNGRFLYTTNNNMPKSSVPAFEIQSSGALKPIVSCGSYCKTEDGADPEGLAVSPSGKFVYASDHEDLGLTKPYEHGIVSAFAIGSGGELSQLACPELTCAIGELTGFFGLAITPDQGPTAAFSDTPAPAGSASAFNGSGSSASPEVTVASYDWSFGDGTSAPNAGPTPSHVYSAPGAYTVTLTVTDSAGCSTEVIYTGQTASCNGSSAATTSHTVTVPASGSSSGSSSSGGGSGSSGSSGSGVSTLVGPSGSGPVLTGLSETERAWREGKASRPKKSPSGTIFSFDLNVAASMTLQFTHTAPGRRSGKSCVAQTKKNKGKRRCTRTIIAGTLPVAGRAGANEVPFDGLLSGRSLGPGSYTLTAVATALGKQSVPATLRFTITGR
jgi:6-phosphogluconolactonase (cycloisomerase 2 family)